MHESNGDLLPLGFEITIGVGLLDLNLSDGHIQLITVRIFTVVLLKEYTQTITRCIAQMCPLFLQHVCHYFSYCNLCDTVPNPTVRDATDRQIFFLKDKIQCVERFAFTKSLETVCNAR